MQNNIQNVRTRNQDGSYSGLIPIGAKASNVELLEGKNVEVKIAEIDEKLKTLASGSPAGVYDTLDDLIAANPSHLHIYVVSADNSWYYFSKTENIWLKGGLFQTVESLEPIFIDAAALGFNLDEIYTGGSIVYITPENEELFNKLKNKHLKETIYFVASGVVIELNQREYNSDWYSYSAQKDSLKIEFNVMSDSATLQAVQIIANKHNLGMVKLQHLDEQDTLFASVDEEGFVKYKKAPINDSIITKENLLSAKGVIDKLACFKSYSGNQITYEPIEDYPLELQCEIKPYQNGSGQPSPTNIRKINGHMSIFISNQNAEMESLLMQEFDTPVFGGSYNNMTGELVSNMRSIVLDGSESVWEVRTIPNGRNKVFMIIDDRIDGNTNVAVQLCNIYKTNPTALPAWDFDGVWVAGNGIYVGGGVAAQYSNDLNAFKAQLQKTPMQIVYEINTPKQTMLPQKLITTLKGSNTIECSTGNMKFKTPMNICKIIEALERR